MANNRNRVWATAVAMSIAGCAPDLGEGADGDAGGPMMVDEMGGPDIGHVDEGDGVWRSTVDATSETDWVYLSLGDGRQVTPANPDDDDSWDLAFRRFHIKMNGGVSGSGNVSAAILPQTEFDEVEMAPADGYAVDEADGDDDNEDPEYVLREWYAYNIMTHVLTPETTVYVVSVDDAAYYRLQVEAYYDDAGTSGHLTFRWGVTDAP